MTFPPDIIEEVARAIVPFSYGAFEDQTPLNPGPRKVGDPWKYPPGTPNEYARVCATAVLTALNWPPPSAAVQEEREACAKVAEEYAKIAAEAVRDPIVRKGPVAVAVFIAEAIRSRSALATGK